MRSEVSFTRERATVRSSCGAAVLTGAVLGKYSPRPPAYPEIVSRTYEVRTYWCQMNVHYSERISGLLDAAG